MAPPFCPRPHLIVKQREEAPQGQEALYWAATGPQVEAQALYIFRRVGPPSGHPGEALCSTWPERNRTEERAKPNCLAISVWRGPIAGALNEIRKHSALTAAVEVIEASQLLSEQRFKPDTPEQISGYVALVTFYKMGMSVSFFFSESCERLATEPDEREVLPAPVERRGIALQIRQLQRALEAEKTTSSSKVGASVG